jgi:hypothetical protein
VIRWSRNTVISGERVAKAAAGVNSSGSNDTCFDSAQSVKKRWKT